MVVHALGDLLGFTVLWPHDRPHPLIWQGGVDPLFWPALAALALLAPLAVAAFLRLSVVTRGARRRPAAEALAAADEPGSACSAERSAGAEVRPLALLVEYDAPVADTVTRVDWIHLTLPVPPTWL